MILSGDEILRQWEEGNIILDPFQTKDINPNSVNFHLGENCICYNRQAKYSEFKFSVEGTTLIPGCLYLTQTAETIGSECYAISLIGRSSMGRLGLFVRVDSDLESPGEANCRRLELRCIKPVTVYRGMAIGQVSFWAMDPISVKRNLSL